MLILLSPAKTLNEDLLETDSATTPRLLADSEKLVGTLRKKTQGDLKTLMKVSDGIAETNVQRFQQFHTPFSTQNAKPALYAFRGDVYVGLDADTLTDDDLAFAQQHLRILSGLYGVLRPMDLMQPYRLEMGTRLKQGKLNNLYEFWNRRITEVLNEDLAANGGEWVINLASKEYFKAIQTEHLQGKVLDIHFKEKRGDDYKVITFNAKRARGAMARQIVQYQITDPERMKDLMVHDYAFEASMSDAGQFTFVK